MGLAFNHRVHSIDGSYPEVGAFFFNSFAKMNGNSEVMDPEVKNAGHRHA